MNLSFFKKILAAASLSLVLILSGYTSVLATENNVDYTPLVNLPGVSKSQTDKSVTFNTYIPGVFKLSIGVAGVLAVLMIVFGGVEYITAESMGGKKNGQDRINNALIGLVLIIGSYAILSTISPSLLSFDLNIKAVPLPSVSSSTPLTSVPATGGVWPSDLAERTSINGILSVNKSNCLAVGQSNCTSLTGIGNTVLNGLTQLKNKCNCIVTITGGTEYWLHDNGNAIMNLNGTKHKPGGNVVDISLNGGTLVFFQANEQYQDTTPGCSVGTERYYFAGGLFVNEQIPGNAPHFHVCF